MQARKCRLAQNLDTPSFESHFSGSTAPQAFPRPDRRMLTPARAGRVKAGRFFSGHRRLGLDRAEHDGTLVGSGSAFFLLLFAAGTRLVRYAAPGSRFSSQSAWRRCNIRFEAQKLQGPQRARTVVRLNGLRRSHLHLRPVGQPNDATRSAGHCIQACDLKARKGSPERQTA
jgi:hypothetical protein